MRERVHWYSRSPITWAEALSGVVRTTAVVVGGGIAGLSAAQWLSDKGVDVVLLEARFCGSGASGKSSGFITPDSELELHQLERRFGSDDARSLWSAATEACRLIRWNIKEFAIECDLVEADALYVANDESGFEEIVDVYDAHRRLGFESQLYRGSELGEILGSVGYAGGVKHPGSFGIDTFAYVQGLKRVLISKGVRIFENSPVVEVEPHRVRTPAGVVEADSILFSVDRYAPEINVANKQSYHAQTFIALSEPLRQDQLKRIFPARSLLVWDTDLIYQYFRQTGDGRLLVGGGLLSETYARHKSHDERSVNHLLSYVREKFPDLGSVEFTSFWPGMIGVTKDLLPLAGQSELEPSHYYAMCSAGLPWSTLAGRVAACRAIELETEFDRFFDPGRVFNFIEPLQPVIGKPPTFALSHYYAKNYQTGSADAMTRSRDITLAALCAGGLLGGFSAGYLLKRLVSGRGTNRKRITESST